jgi:hypothetical protein
MLKWLIDRRNKWNKGFSHKALLGPKSQEKVTQLRNATVYDQ